MTHFVFVKRIKLNHQVCCIELFIKLLRFFQGNCDFDLHLCLWTHSSSIDFTFNWMRKRYSTPSWNTGPTGDHTSGSDTFNVVVIVVVIDVLSYLTHYIFTIFLMTLHSVVCIFYIK